MDGETINVVKVTPVQSSTEPVVNAIPVEPNLQQTVEETAQCCAQAVNQFSDKKPSDKEKEAINYLNKLKSYMNSQKFKNDVNNASIKYDVPPKAIAQNFFERALGTVGDILGIAISVVCDGARLIINFASVVCYSVINLIETIARGIVSIVTLNKTCSNI